MVSYLVDAIYLLLLTFSFIIWYFIWLMPSTCFYSHFLSLYGILFGLCHLPASTYIFFYYMVFYLVYAIYLLLLTFSFIIWYFIWLIPSTCFYSHFLSLYGILFG